MGHDVCRRVEQKLRQENTRLRAALAPFVQSYERDAEPIGDSDLDNEQPRSVRMTLGDCRKAARVLHAVTE